MGVRRNDWIVIGVNIDKKKYYNDHRYDEDFEPYDEKPEMGEITYLIDSMDSKYFIVGEVLVAADGNDGLGLSEFPLMESNEFKESAKRVKAFLQETFGIEDAEPKLIVLTHWA